MIIEDSSAHRTTARELLQGLCEGDRLAESPSRNFTELRFCNLHVPALEASEIHPGGDHPSYSEGPMDNQQKFNGTPVDIHVCTWFERNAFGVSLAVVPVIDCWQQYDIRVVLQKTLLSLILLSKFEMCTVSSFCALDATHFGVELSIMQCFFVQCAVIVMARQLVFSDFAH